MALAAPVTLETMSFDTQGSEAATNGVPVTLNNLLGIYFSNAYIFDAAMIGQTPTSGSNPRPAGSTTGGFLVNRSQTSNAGALTMSLAPISAAVTRTAASPAPIEYPGQFFQSVAVRLFSAGNIEVRAYSLGVEVALQTLPGGTPTQQIWTDTAQTLNFDEALRIDSLRFSAGDTGARQLGMDDLSITLTAATNNNVPEPASYALVAMALLAAGGATRRKA